VARTLVSYLWKTPLCALAYVAGTLVGGAAASSLGLPLPAIPTAADQTTQLVGLLVGSVLLALVVGPLAARINGGLLARWLVLTAFSYVCLGLNTALEAGIFTKLGGMTGIAVITIVPCVLLALAAALLFPSKPGGEAVATGPVSWRSWLWRLPTALLAFPIIYFVFGIPVGLLVGDYYRQEAFGLVLPSLGVVIGVQVLRSALFLLASLPIAIRWSGSRTAFILVFGLAFFVLTGLFGMAQAYWLPAEIRRIHTVELFADAMTYACALAVLLRVQPSVSPINPEGPRWKRSGSKATSWS
jgi:hypothetical protein